MDKKLKQNKAKKQLKMDVDLKKAARIMTKNQSDQSKCVQISDLQYVYATERGAIIR